MSRLHTSNTDKTKTGTTSSPSTSHANDPWEEIMRPGRSIGVTQEDLDQMSKVGVVSKKKKIIIALIVSLVTIVLIAGFWVILKQATDRKNEIIEQNAQSTYEAPKKVESKTQDKSIAYVNPSLDSGQVGQPATGSTEARVDGDKIILKSEAKESSVEFPGLKDGKIEATTQSCKLTEVSENCYLGQSTVDGKPVQFWGFRDAKSSALLSLDADPQDVSANGAALAFTQERTDNNAKVHSLYIVLKDQTGVMVSSTDVKPITALTTGDKAFRVQQAD